MTKNELDFWTELRHSITKLENLDVFSDWIEPKTYHLSSPITINGNIGVLMPDMEIFKFVLTIPNQSQNISDISWESLIPIRLNDERLYLNNEILEIALLK